MEIIRDGVTVKLNAGEVYRLLFEDECKKAKEDIRVKLTDYAKELRWGKEDCEENLENAVYDYCCSRSCDCSYKWSIDHAVKYALVIAGE